MDPRAALIDFFSTHASRLGRGPFLIACSGGPDSVALARALHELEPRLNRRFCLAHVNHRLRGRASDADAAFVKKLARSLGWPYLEARRPIRAATGNLEEMARVTRYDALFRMARQKKAAAVLTAHTRDDQVETIFMNLLRGSGVAGVGGMSALRRWAPTKKLGGAAVSHGVEGRCARLS